MYNIDKGGIFMNAIDGLSALQTQLDALPEWEPSSLDPSRSLVLSIDLNQGFTRMGALSSPRVAGIIPETAAFLRRCRELGLSIAAVTDCHEPGAGEFCSYPVHCLEGTPEPELVDEIREFPETLLRKNSTNAFFAPGMTELLSGVETVVVTGCCTDICILQFVLTLKAAWNQEDRPVEILVPRQLVETYDAPGHSGELMGTAALASMLGNGIRVVNYRTE